MIIKIMRTLLIISCCFLSLITHAQSNVTEGTLDKQPTAENVVSAKDKVLEDEALESVKSQPPLEKNKVSKTPQVGKHVMANMDAGSMILSLLMVLGLIIICALVLKRFNLTQKSISPLKVVSSLSLGAKERVVVIQMGEQQLLLGVTGQQVTLLDKLAEPLPEQSVTTTDLPKNILSFLLTKKG